MVIDFAQRIIARLPADIAFALKLQETESSFAEWYASDSNSKFILYFI
jgi:6-pyruvoyltetrahydropterin/6-carboxytetrahydropterin synthase